MYPSNLPKLTIAEEFTSAFHPSGMLDRDQRTTSFGIDRSTISQLTHKNQNRPSSTTSYVNNNHHHHHSHQINFDGTTTSTACKMCTNISHQTKDNNETVMCLLTKNVRKSDNHRSRMKFPAIFQVTAWIIFFTININLITAKPLGSMMLSEGEIKSICKATTFNIKTTNYSTETLKHEMEEYQKTTNTADISQWNHYGGSIDKKNVEELFKETKPLEVYKNALKEMHEHLLAARNNLNSHLCQHTNDKYMGHTLHIMGLNDSENDLVVSYLESIRRYNELSIVQLEEAHEELRSVPKAEINCTLVPNTGVVAEIITMRKLQATLTYMTNFFNHVEQKFCLGK